MNMRLPVITAVEGGSVSSVPGLRSAALRTGVKPSGDIDLGLLVADEPMSAAGMFTTSAVAAAPVALCRRVLDRHDRVRSVVVNSGNANALTGHKGEDDACAMALETEQRCGGPALVLSTGVIGVPLPVDAVTAGIATAASELEPDDDGFSRAILTTDTAPKTVAVRCEGDGHEPFTVGGTAKGSGMIHPRMATMLAVMATDAPMETSRLRSLLERAVDRSFHEISVDGDTSTNDAVLLLARAPRPGETVSADQEEMVEQAVTQVARQLAEKIVADGEGASRVMEISVVRARGEEEARQIARSIACSSLVKTALAGGDPNWGRILSAAGNAGVPLSPNRMTLSLGNRVVFRNGQPLDTDEEVVARAFAADRVRVELDVARGEHHGRMLTTDLTHRYVEINSEYTT